MFGQKTEVKKHTVKEIFADINALVSELANTNASLESIMAAETPLQYDVRHSVMLVVASKRTNSPCVVQNANMASPKCNPHVASHTESR
jgi:hypothetical protein